MEKKTYRYSRMIISTVVAVLVAVSVLLGNLLLAFITLLLGFLVSYFIKKNVYEITEDERTALVANKASRMAMLFFLTIITVLGVGLLTLKNSFPEFTQAGFTLADSACLLLLLYSGFYIYYNKKHG
ncbi:DUF2178 domain-containing protein [Methanobacterium aggregans]|uniref:DUF2178 domain-containing protein n=1 Tax=Methanobacterium aggregans TaxID=1615586 RepID=UPI001AE26E52|nr:DUF2178 domain-containing protein [Methanobacterium aggregans]MBP2045616.1 putative membrane protein [Methanobacterium aggregans]